MSHIKANKVTHTHTNTHTHTHTHTHNEAQVSDVLVRVLNSDRVMRQCSTTHWWGGPEERGSAKSGTLPSAVQRFEIGMLVHLLEGQHLHLHPPGNKDDSNIKHRKGRWGEEEGEQVKLTLVKYLSMMLYASL